MINIRHENPTFKILSRVLQNGLAFLTRERNEEQGRAKIETLTSSLARK
jgi:hypothetical protein